MIFLYFPFKSTKFKFGDSYKSYKITILHVFTLISNKTECGDGGGAVYTYS